MQCRCKQGAGTEQSVDAIQVWPCAVSMLLCDEGVRGHAHLRVPGLGSVVNKR
jgi:hypothetical protein